MKVIKKQIKKCENSDWSKTNVLDLLYTHKKKEWRVLVKDYDDANYNVILKQIRKAVKEQYDELEKKGD